MSFSYGDWAQLPPIHLGSHSLEASRHSKEFLRSVFFRRNWSFMMEKSTPQGPQSFLWKLPTLQHFFFFPVWVHTCIAVADIPAGMVMFSPSLEITSGFSVGPVAPTMDAPGGTDQGCVCSLCSSASWDKDSFPEASGTPGCAPSKGRALASCTCSFPLGWGGNAQTPASCAF